MQSKESIEAEVRKYKEVIRKDPNDGNAWYNLGVFLAKLGNYEEAIEASREATKINPNDAEAHYNLGVVYDRVGRHREAIKTYKEAIRISPNLHRAFFNLGNAYFKSGLYKESINAFQECIRINPDDVASHYNLGNMYLQIGDRNSAFHEYKKLVGLNKTQADKLSNILNQVTPIQYDILFELLCEYSKKYYTETERIFRKFDNKWDPHASRFEIDVFCLFELSKQMLGLKQDMDVVRGIQSYFVERLMQRFKNKITIATTFEDVIGARVQRYGQARNDCIKNDKTIDMVMLDEVIQNIRMTNLSEEIVANRGLVVGDFFELIELKSAILPIQIKSGEFSCCLKHIFKSTSDIRSLSSEEIDILINRGRQDAKQILSKLDLSQISDSINITKHIRTIFAQRKKWWQFWK